MHDDEEEEEEEEKIRSPGPAVTTHKKKVTALGLFCNCRETFLNQMEYVISAIADDITLVDMCDTYHHSEDSMKAT